VLNPWHQHRQIPAVSKQCFNCYQSGKLFTRKPTPCTTQLLKHTCGRLVPAREVWQGALLEAVEAALAAHRLLTHTRNHLQPHQWAAGSRHQAAWSMQAATIGWTIK
jgi:hypothetical protein